MSGIRLCKMGSLRQSRREDVPGATEEKNALGTENPLFKQRRGPVKFNMINWVGTNDVPKKRLSCAGGQCGEGLQLRRGIG